MTQPVINTRLSNTAAQKLVNYRMVCDVFTSACFKEGLGFLKKKRKKIHNKELTLVLLKKIIDNFSWGKDRLVKHRIFLY